MKVKKVLKQLDDKIQIICSTETGETKSFTKDTIDPCFINRKVKAYSVVVGNLAVITLADPKSETICEKCNTTYVRGKEEEENPRQAENSQEVIDELNRRLAESEDAGVRLCNKLRENAKYIKKLEAELLKYQCKNEVDTDSSGNYEKENALQMSDSEHGKIEEIIKLREGGMKVLDVCKQMKISDNTYYRWKHLYEKENGKGIWK